MNNEEILDHIEGVASPILENLGYRLLEKEIVLESGRFVLRLYIDRDGNAVTIGDCATASHAVEDAIAAENIIEHRYVLEVSSPGLNRPIKGEKDFRRYAGKTVKVRTKEPIDGRSNYKGVIGEIKGEFVCLTIDNQIFEIPFDKILKARLVPELEIGKEK